MNRDPLSDEPATARWIGDNIAEASPGKAMLTLTDSVNRRTAMNLLQQMYSTDCLHVQPDGLTVIIDRSPENGDIGAEWQALIDYRPRNPLQ